MTYQMTMSINQSISYLSLLTSPLQLIPYFMNQPVNDLLLLDSGRQSDGVGPDQHEEV